MGIALDRPAAVALRVGVASLAERGGRALQPDDGLVHVPKVGSGKEPVKDASRAP